MAFLDLHDVRLHYEFEQQPDRDVLVFSNSLGSNLSMWSPQMRPLGEQFSLLRYDSRGHGESSVPPYPYTIEQMSKDVLALLDGLGLERVHFCGLSLGGVVGQWLGAHAPARLKSLVLCSTAAKIGNEASWNERIATVRREGLASVVPGTLERWFTPAFRQGSPALLSTVKLTGAMLMSADPAGYAASCAALRDCDQREAVKGIQVPTLVVFGRYDPVTTPQDADYLLRTIMGSRPLELPAAHLSNVEAALEFNAGVKNFLLQQSSQTAEA